MNQILDVKEKKLKIKMLFKIQFILSFGLMIIVLVYFLSQMNNKSKENNISKVISLNAKLNSVFSENIQETYLGRIKIDKINLDYFVYNTYSDKLLKVLPCKFFGGNLHHPGNICIIGHNYFDNRFFSNLNKLDINDIIIMEDLDGNKYKYTVYNIYEINEKQIEEVQKNDGNYKTLTLCTCTFDKNRRLIIKARVN